MAKNFAAALVRDCVSHSGNSVIEVMGNIYTGRVQVVVCLDTNIYIRWCSGGNGKHAIHLHSLANSVQSRTYHLRLI